MDLLGEFQKLEYVDRLNTLLSTPYELFGCGNTKVQPRGDYTSLGDKQHLLFDAPSFSFL